MPASSTSEALPDSAFGFKAGWNTTNHQSLIVETQEVAMSSERELIDTGTDKRYVRRDDQGRFKEVVDVGRSLSQDQRRQAKTEVKSGHGDEGDRKKK